MNKKLNRRVVRPLLLWLLLLAGAFEVQGERVNIANPYESVDWETAGHHKAALHVHTLQSDGFHSVDEVVRAYHAAGFSILSITDHDYVSPNRQVRLENVPEEEATPYPDPRPENYPANSTWPWTNFGAPSPEELGMLGIEGVELSSRHHANAFFNGYGVANRRDAPSDDEQLAAVGRAGGVAFLDHPGILANWWVRQPLEWYVERYANNPADTLVGLEISGEGYYDYDVAVWDQLLAEFMPDRPVWGFSTDDMHRLWRVGFRFTVFLLDELTEENVKQAMRDGNFYFVRGEAYNDLREGQGKGVYDGTYPLIHSIRIDREQQRIVIDASGYDEIVWISNPPSNEEIEDYRTASQAWPAGEVLQRGNTFDYSGLDRTRSYVRAEIIRHDEEGPIRVFTNPFGLRAMGNRE